MRRVTVEFVSRRSTRPLQQPLICKVCQEERSSVESGESVLKRMMRENDWFIKNEIVHASQVSTRKTGQKSGRGCVVCETEARVHKENTTTNNDDMMTVERKQNRMEKRDNQTRTVVKYE